MQCRMWLNKKPKMTSDGFWSPVSHIVIRCAITFLFCFRSRFFYSVGRSEGWEEGSIHLGWVSSSLLKTLGEMIQVCEQCKHTYIKIYIDTHKYSQTYICTCKLTYKHKYKYMQTYLQTDIQTCTHTYIHTYILMYIHTNIPKHTDMCVSGTWTFLFLLGWCQQSKLQLSARYNIHSLCFNFVKCNWKKRENTAPPC